MSQSRIDDLLACIIHEKWADSKRGKTPGKQVQHCSAER